MLKARVWTMALATCLAVLVAPAPASTVRATDQAVDRTGVTAPTCTATPPLASGSTGSGVSCLQFTLVMLGLSAPYSGTFDERTESAVREFQQLHPPIMVTGRADELTLRAIGIYVSAPIWAPAVTTPTTPPPTTVSGALGGAAAGANPVRQACVADADISPDERGESVACLQRRLTELGFYAGSISGLHDRATQDALKAFQRQTPPLRVDAVGGSRTLAALDIWSGMTVGGGRATGPGPFPAPQQDQPQWNLDAGGIPFFGNRKSCSPSEAAVIAAEFANDGADAATQQWAVYIASREGGCRYEAVNINARTRDDSHCTFQLNALSGTFQPHGELGRRGWTATNVKSSLQACADAASDLWVYCGRGPWIPPYSCRPPWSGATNGQPPALIPPPPDTVVSEPSPSTTTTPSTPTTTTPTATTPTTPTTTTTVAPPATTTVTTVATAGTGP